MDYLDTVIGAVVALVAMRTGMGMERRKRKKKEAICGCKHHYSFHKEGGGGCGKYTMEGTCRCQKYSGPIPYDDFIA